MRRLLAFLLIAGGTFPGCKERALLEQRAARLEAELAAREQAVENLEADLEAFETLAQEEKAADTIHPENLNEAAVAQALAPAKVEKQPGHDSVFSASGSGGPQAARAALSTLKKLSSAIRAMSFAAGLHEWRIAFTFPTLSSGTPAARPQPPAAVDPDALSPKYRLPWNRKAAMRCAELEARLDELARYANDIVAYTQATMNRQQEILVLLSDAAAAPDLVEQAVVWLFETEALLVTGTVTGNTADGSLLIGGTLKQGTTAKAAREKLAGRFALSQVTISKDRLDAIATFPGAPQGSP
jgi:hypothetical protein